MGSIKDRNGMDLTEAEDIKKRWQEYTEELYKKELHARRQRAGSLGPGMRRALLPGGCNTRGAYKLNKQGDNIQP